MVEVFLTTIWNVPGASTATTTSELSVETAGGRTGSVRRGRRRRLIGAGLGSSTGSTVAASSAAPTGASSTSSCQPRNVSHPLQNDAESR